VDIEQDTHFFSCRMQHSIDAAKRKGTVMKNT